MVERRAGARPANQANVSSSCGRRSASFRSKASRRPADRDRRSDPVRPVAAQYVRGHAEQFATDHLALAIAKGGYRQGFRQAAARRRNAAFSTCRSSTARISPTKPVHAAVQRAGRRGAAAATRRSTARIIARFGRFPHGNAMLGRAPRPDELAAGDVVRWWLEPGVRSGPEFEAGFATGVARRLPAIRPAHAARGRRLARSACRTGRRRASCRPRPDPNASCIASTSAGPMPRMIGTNR